jgi:hypothetical protein
VDELAKTVRCRGSRVQKQDISSEIDEKAEPVSFMYPLL